MYSLIAVFTLVCQGLIFLFWTKLLSEINFRMCFVDLIILFLYVVFARLCRYGLSIKLCPIFLLNTVYRLHTLLLTPSISFPTIWSPSTWSSYYFGPWQEYSRFNLRFSLFLKIPIIHLGTETYVITSNNQRNFSNFK